MWKLYLTQCSRLPLPQRDILPKERAEQRQPVIHQMKKNSKNRKWSPNQFEEPPCQCPWRKAWRPERGAGTRPTGSPGSLTASRSPEFLCNVPWPLNLEPWCDRSFSSFFPTENLWQFWKKFWLKSVKPSSRDCKLQIQPMLSQPVNKLRPKNLVVNFK